jgi:hypothetical protein
MDKKEAIRKFKEQKIPQGAYAIRCAATNRVWVGASRNLNSAKNLIWFSLRQGNYREPTLQTEWNARGSEADFQYEILEVLDDNVLSMEVADLLKAKRQAWIEVLGAEALP